MWKSTASPGATAPVEMKPLIWRRTSSAERGLRRRAGPGRGGWGCSGCRPRTAAGGRPRTRGPPGRCRRSTSRSRGARGRGPDRRGRSRRAPALRIPSGGSAPTPWWLPSLDPPWSRVVCPACAVSPCPVPDRSQHITLRTHAVTIRCELAESGMWHSATVTPAGRASRGVCRTRAARTAGGRISVFYEAEDPGVRSVARSPLMRRDGPSSQSRPGVAPAVSMAAQQTIAVTWSASNSRAVRGGWSGKRGMCRRPRGRCRGRSAPRGWRWLPRGRARR